MFIPNNNGDFAQNILMTNISDCSSPRNSGDINTSDTNVVYTEVQELEAIYQVSAMHTATSPSTGEEIVVDLQNAEIPIGELLILDNCIYQLI